MIKFAKQINIVIFVKQNQIKMTAQIKYNEIILDCEGDKYNGSKGDRLTPPEAPYFKLNKVSHCDVDITDIIADNVFENIENEINETVF